MPGITPWPRLPPHTVMCLKSVNGAALLPAAGLLRLCHGPSGPVAWACCWWEFRARCEGWSTRWSRVVCDGRGGWWCGGTPPSQCGEFTPCAGHCPACPHPRWLGWGKARPCGVAVPLPSCARSHRAQAGWVAFHPSLSRSGERARGGLPRAYCVWPSASTRVRWRRPVQSDRGCGMCGVVACLLCSTVGFVTPLAPA